MDAIASQITNITIVYSIVYSDADQRKHQSSASLAFVRGIRRGPVNSPHKWPVTRKMFPFDDVIMMLGCNYPSMLYLNYTLPLSGKDFNFKDSFKYSVFDIEKSICAIWQRGQETRQVNIIKSIH